MSPLRILTKISTRWFLATLICLGVLLLAAQTRPALADTVLYVKETATGNGDCTTWADACTLQFALGEAASGDEIWVAAGTHTPHTSDRTMSFVLQNGVAVYGGFAGTETLLVERDITANPTILSGDLARNDQTGGDNSENAYHVVVGDGTDATAVLDGFTISGGNADGTISPDDRGGGMLNQAGSPVLRHLTFSHNSAISGGGMRNDGHSSPTLSDVTFSDNGATTIGGGIYNETSSPILTNVTFTGNSATHGGGGMYNAFSSPALTNVTFSDNSATNSGSKGLFNEASSNPTLTNVIIANSVNGGDCVNDGTSSLNPASSHNLIEDGANACGLTDGVDGNIIGADPNLGPLADNGGATQTHALLAGSPAIDAGTNSGCAATDQRGMTRPVGVNCDIGAFELYTGVYHVKAAATGSMDCRSWADACTLQFALHAAAGGDELWVAAGTYTPHASDRTVSFVLKTGVAVYGGFAGTEDELIQRDIAANRTILSGDLAGDDNDTVIYNEPTRFENAYHVVVGSGTDSTAVLDGFTITGGNANINPFPNAVGGGMLNQTGSPTLANVTFSANTARAGGGMSNSSSSPTLTDVTFSGNTALIGGGGMGNDGDSSPTLMDVTFSDNSADRGGGMSNDTSSPTLMNVTFSGNSAPDFGGGLYNEISNPKLTNVTFSGNEASNGGGMYNYSISSPLLNNVTFFNNSASNGGGMSNENQANPTLTNVIIANSVSGGDCVNDAISSLNPASSHNLIEDGANACGLADGVNGNLIGTNPNLGPLADNGGATQTHALLAGSPAIDTGANSGCPTTDQRGMTRPVGANCDIGAFELYTGVYHVKTAATGNMDCQSWDGACTLQFALHASADGDELWVAAGTYKPHASDRTVSFVLKTGVVVFGGFAGTETLLEERNIPANLTILSGDLAGDDNANIDLDEPTRAENAYHVVVSSGTDGTAVLDGFTISGGNANGASDPDYSGGGMLTQGGSPTVKNVTFSGNSANYGGGMISEYNSSPTLMDVTFSGNAAFNGGGMYNGEGSPILTHVIFSGNAAASLGGGMRNASSSPTLMDVAFSGNSAINGGGMFNEASSPTLMDVTFSENSADNGGGGGMANDSSSSVTLTNVTFSTNSADWGGGMHNFDSNPVLTNVTFSGNTATWGGGMYNEFSSPTLINSTISGNVATTDGGGIYNETSSPVLANVIIANSSGGDCVNDISSSLDPASSHNLIADGANACGLMDGVDGNIIGAVPKLGPLANNGGATQTHALLSNSPAIDAGDDTTCPASDQRGVARPQGSACDIGAYEVNNQIFLPLMGK